jgi:hypothetical protein
MYYINNIMLVLYWSADMADSPYTIKKKWEKTNPEGE